MNEPYENSQNPFSSDAESNSEPVQAPVASKPAKAGWTAGKVIAIALVCSLLGGLCGAGGVFLGGQLLKTDEAPKPQTNVSNVLEGLR